MARLVLLDRLPEVQKDYTDRLAFYDTNSDTIVLINDLTLIRDKIESAVVETHNQCDYVSCKGPGFHYYLMCTAETRALLT
jgi:hypothetical protein